MMLLCEDSVCGANLRESAAAVEAERGIVIVFSALQFPSLARARRVVSFIAHRNAKSQTNTYHARSFTDFSSAPFLNASGAAAFEMSPPSIVIP